MTKGSVSAVLAVLWLVAMAGGRVEAVTDEMLKIACEDMTPRHPGYKAENVLGVPCPFVLVVDTVPVVPGDLVNVTLTSYNGSTPFKGFMVQARDSDKNVLGTYLPDCKSSNQSHHMISCSNGVEPYNVAVQSNNKYKFRETFTWVAPVTLKGPFRFKYTIVQNFEHYWTGIESEDIQVAELSQKEFQIKSSINHEYYVYKLYLKNCYGD